MDSLIAAAARALAAGDALEALKRIALRDLRGSPRTLEATAAHARSAAARANALHARLIAARRLLLLGRGDETAAAPAQALGASQRTVQRALAEREAAGRARSIGRARARRWLSPPLAGFTTILLLPAALPAA